MKLYLLKLACFFVLLSVGDRSLAWVMSRLVTNSQFRYSRLYSGNIDADVVVLGNSRAVNAFYCPDISSELGVSCMNLAYNGMNASMVRAVLLDHLDRNRRPKLIVVELSCVDSDVDGILNMKPYWHQSPRLLELAQRDAPRSCYATRISRLFGMNSEVFLRALYFMRVSDESWIRRVQIGEELIDETESMQPFDLQLPTEMELADLVAVQKIAADRGIDCQFVVAPYLPLYKEKISNFEEWLSEIESALDGSVTDLSAALSEDSDFSDRIHTNFTARMRIFRAARESGVFNALDSKPRSIF